MAESLLELAGLSVSYGGVRALEDVSVRVPDGGAVCLLGPNGAGKTTLLRAISGLLRFHGGRITAGTIRYDGHDVTGAFAANLVKAGIVQVLERRHVFPELSVADNLRSGAFTRRDRRRTAERQREVVDMFPVLGQRLRQEAGLLSGGEQQMLAIGRALMGEPRLLMLDEPSLGLAPLVVQAIGQTLNRIREQGVSILLVEQSSALASAVTDDGYLLETGRVRTVGPTRDLVSDQQVRAVYLGVQA
ncbi:MAG TPA: ABC transporter ATP-binding protein [Acidimicrobiales bacterium]|nr:ABC transporter ATP-binding protein [Acidimicrobiales bacterium]